MRWRSPPIPTTSSSSAAATLAKWAAAGCVVNHLVCTDGSKGSWDPADDMRTLVATRQDEQRAAAKALGATGEVVLLGAVDGELESTSRCAARSPDGSAGSGPTSCSATTRGVATGCIPITVTPAS